MNVKNYLSIFILMILMGKSYAQQEIQNGCGVNLSLKEQKTIKEATEKIVKQPRYQNLLAGIDQSKTNGTYKIPVVFHILHNGEGDGPNNQNEIPKDIMACKIADAIDVVNKDFRGEYPGFNTTDPRFDSVKDKLDNIEFILAKEDPDGNLMEAPGMNWLADGELISWGYDERITDYPWWWGKNGKYYLQVFIVHYPNQNGSWNQSGHAFLPNGIYENEFPRIVYNWRYIGTKSSCGGYGINGGPGFEKVFSHEVGHYFGLSHVFGPYVDGEPACADGDGLADTPDTLGAEGCNRDVLNECGVYPNLENHMDYNTACQNMFTQQQVALMRYWLEDTDEVRFPRGLLWQEGNLRATGILPDVPEAKFSSDLTALCGTGQSVQFKDASNGLPTSRLWTFEGGNPTMSTDINPVVQYDTPGKYKVTLQVTNDLGQNTTEIVDYIHVDQRGTSAVSENFEGTFPPHGWDITNPDGELTWIKRSDAGYGDSSSMVMNNAENDHLGVEDYIRLPFYDFSSASKSQMYFHLAYTRFDNNSPDVLKVEVSIDCGNSWSEVYSKTHTELETFEVPTSQSNGWVPNKDQYWRKEIVDLSDYDGESNVAIRFRNISGYGTRIWIDNVNVVLENDVAPTSDFYAMQRSTICNDLDVSFEDTSVGNPTSWEWTFAGGTPESYIGQNPPQISYNGPGAYTVSLKTTNGNGDNTSVKTGFITIVQPHNNSLSEDFSGNFPPHEWTIHNPDSGLGWEKRDDAGRGDITCMVMNNADNEELGAIDEITLHPIDMSVGETDFSFDVAYTRFDDNSPDVLKVMASKDCGVTWSEVYAKTHTELETFGPTATPNDWIPTEDEHWRTERILLNEFKGESNVLIKFVNISGYGTRIWIDNINFTFDSMATPFSDFNLASAQICSDVAIDFEDRSTGSPTTWQWIFEGGNPSSSTDQNPSVVYDTPGVYNVQLIATNVFGTGTTMVKNDFVVVGEKGALPLEENFQGDFPIEGWTVINPDEDEIFWEKRSDVGNGDSACLVINNADNPVDKVDELILESLDFSSTDGKSLEFDIAYTKYNSAIPDNNVDSPDRLEILISTDCGATWNSVYDKTHHDLQTVEVIDDPDTDSNEPNDWIPSQEDHWRKEILDLTAYAENPNVLVKLKNTSGFGTRIWIDNLKITDSGTLTVDDFESIGKIGVYPNPFKNSFNINIPGNTIGKTTVKLYDIRGKVLLEKVSKIGEEHMLINNITVAPGSYFVKITSEENTKTFQVIKR